MIELHPILGGRTDRLSVHHVLPARLGGDDTLANLATMCVRCHRRADAQLRRTEAAKLALRAEANLVLEHFEDDPERGIFYGPPREPGGTPRRWSRHWFDWRPEELGQRNK